MKKVRENDLWEGINMPQISVIVPVYKVEAYLNRCIESILKQSFTDFELILIEDGSPDNCGAICDEYASKDNRVVVIHQKNEGLSVARNKGLDWAFENSNSEWISFVDSDDWIHPLMLETLLKVNKKNNTNISICGYANIEETQCVDTKLDVKDVIYCTEEFYCTHEINATVAWGKLYRKSLYIDKRYPVGKIHEDEFLTYKILFECTEIAFVPEALYFNCNNPSSIMRSKWSARRLVILDAIEERIKYFENRGNANMVAYCQKQLYGSKAYTYLQAYANHQVSCFPKKYKMHFFKALRMLEETCGRDRYEAMMVSEYPHIIKTQAYCRKIVSLIKESIFSMRDMATFLYMMMRKMILENKRFDNMLAIVTIAKFEAPYIQEWIDYHLLQGIGRIYLYDNDSPDSTKEILEPYIKSGKVVYTYFPGKGRQLDAYNDAIRRFKHLNKYMAFLDCDEFLVQENPECSLIDTIEQIMKKSFRCAGVAVNWRVYGSSGYINAPKGYVMENYLNRGDSKSKGSDCIKTIANPRLIKKYSHVHYPTYWRGFFNVNEEGIRCDGAINLCGETKYIRINHYFTKSKEEWIVRRSKGKADTVNDGDIRTLDEFFEHDHNDIYDPIMLPYVKKMKEIKDHEYIV